MNTSLFIIFGCLFYALLTPSLKAQTHSENVDAYQHLFEVNKEWKHFAVAAPTQKIRFASDTKRIRFHLETVIAHLSKLKSSNQTEAADEKRQRLLKKLKDYAEQEIFPQNIHHANRQPYFIDHKGTHCAVGYLMKVSGAGDLAKKISTEQNYDYLADIKTEGVTAWADQHGFSLKELAWIQPGYLGGDPIENVGKGTNGPVNSMAVGYNKLYLAGAFNLLDSLPCLNIGVYEMGQLSCLGNGIDGKINDIAYKTTGTKVIVVGDLIDPAGNHVPVAIYNPISGWTYESIPGRPNAEGMSVLETNTWYMGTEVVIKSPSTVGDEIWRNKVGAWELHCTAHGELFDIHYGDDRWYGGSFDSITLHQVGMLDTVLYTHNLIALDVNNDPTTTVSVGDTLLPDTIRAITSYGITVYFGGHSHDIFKPLVTRLLNGSFQPIVFEYNMTLFLGGMIVNHPKVFNMSTDPSTGDLYIAGNMRNSPVIGTIYSSIFKYDVGDFYLEGYNVFDSTATSVQPFQGELIIGGPFSATIGSNGYTPLNHFVRPQVLSTTVVLKDELSLKVFPNPTSSAFTMDLGQYYVDVNVEISNALGQLVYQERFNGTNSINLSLEGEIGLYLVKVKAAESESIIKIVKY